jgi:hypothetical protein
MKSSEYVFKSEVHGHHMVHLSLISTWEMATYVHEDPWRVRLFPSKILNGMTPYSNKVNRI